MQFPNDANGQVLRNMAASGMDMRAEYDFDFEHIFPDKRTAEHMCDAVAALGYQSDLHESDVRAGYFYDVRVIVRLRPTHENVSRIERQLGELAERFDGLADGWGVLQE